MLVAQRLGQVGKELVGEGEGYQFGMLVGAAAGYVASAWWVVAVSGPSAKFMSGINVARAEPTHSTLPVLLSNCGLSAFLDVAGGGPDHSYLPHVYWICSTSHQRDRDELYGAHCGLQCVVVRRRRCVGCGPWLILVRRSLLLAGWVSDSSTQHSTPLLSNILPHLQTLVNFVSNTLPKPVLFALIYRLIVLHFASRILPNIGADSWEDESEVNNAWEGRPVSVELSVQSCSMMSTDSDRRHG